MNTLSKIESLKKSNPEIVITVEWELDEYFEWDGDGPDPQDEGFSSYTVIVRAYRIAKGELETGAATLGGCYSKDAGKDDPEISGYLDQLIEDSLKDLNS